MKLDPRTVTIMIIVGASLMGGGLLAVTRGYLGQVRGGSRWATATLVQALGWILMGPLRGVVPDLISIVIGYGFLTLSLALYLIILAEFSDKRIHSAWVYGMVVVQSVVLTGFVVTGQSGATRTIFVSACVATLMLRTSHLLLSGPERRRASPVFTAFMFAACGTMMLARGFYELTFDAHDRAPQALASMMDDITYLTFYVTATLLTFGFVLMLGDRYNLQQKRAETSLQESLREKEALLQEVHHRVKNNLQLITSLMRLEAGRRREPETQAVLKEMQARIRSVVLLNETLYRTGSYSRVNLADYLRQIATHLFAAQNADPATVRLALDLAPVEVETRQAIPCGLIVNELVTNSLKHAFGAVRSGEVRIGLQREVDGSVRLRVSDNGAGLPADFAAKRGKSLGLQLVSDLAKQLLGTLEVGPDATFTITFVPPLIESGQDLPLKALTP